MHIHITLTPEQDLSQEDEEKLLGGPAAGKIVSGESIELQGPETTDPDATNAIQSFHNGHIKGYGTSYQ